MYSESNRVPSLCKKIDFMKKKYKIRQQSLNTFHSHDKLTKAMFQIRMHTLNIVKAYRKRMQKKFLEKMQ